MSDQTILSHRVQIRDDKPVVLYLHGFMGCKEDWSQVDAGLGSEFSSLAVDLPGHGETAKLALEDHDFGMPVCAEQIVRLLDHLHIERCRPLAYSMGGRLGLFLLTHFPERFEAAVIESSSPGLETEGERAVRRNFDRELASELVQSGLDAFLDRWYSQPLFSTLDRADAGFHELMERRLKSDPERLARSLRFMGTGAQPSLWTRLSDVSCPVLFVAGELDSKYRTIADRMHPLCRQSEVAIIPGARHNVHFEQPDAYIQKVRSFLAANR